MRECPWCHYMNLNVYAYCQRCGRGFAPPPEKEPTLQRKWRALWPFKSKPEEEAA